jgi:hypothetical protein
MKNREIADFARRAPYLQNFSQPTTLLTRVPVVLYVTVGGSDTISNYNHGETLGTAFATWDAALNWAKTRYVFTGRLNTVELRFGPGNWGFFSLGSNLLQAQDWFPFAIGVTHADPTDLPRFNAVTNGSFAGAQLIYAFEIEVGYVVSNRKNQVIAWNLRLWNFGVVNAAFQSGVGGTMWIFGDIRLLESVEYSQGLFYSVFEGSFMSIENGDVPSIFPAFNLILDGFTITTPHKFRVVLGGGIWAGSFVYPQLTYASQFWCDDMSSRSRATNPDADNAFTFRGSGANGIFVSYPDGLTISTHTLPDQAVNSASGSGFMTAATTTWVYPTSYIAIPSVFGNVPGASIRWITASSGLTQAGVRQHSWVTSAVELPSRVVAVGWKY